MCANIRDILTLVYPHIQGNFLLTISDHETMKNVFSGYKIEKIEVPYSIGKEAKSREKYGELLIRNFE